MTHITSDRNDPNINVPAAPGEQNRAYIVLPEEALARGYVRPLRREYVHSVCRTRTIMPLKCAETYAVNPKFYGATWCCYCRAHLPVGEFSWVDDNTVLGT